MAKCSHCLKSGLFFRVEKSGYCKNCERIVKLEAEERELQSRLDSMSLQLSAANTHLADTVNKREELFKEIADSAKSAALQEIALRIQNEERRYAACIENTREIQLTLEQLKVDEIKATKSISLASNKLNKVKNHFKALQYAVTRHQNSDQFDNSILNDQSAQEAEAILEPTVKLKFHFMDIRELKKAYQANEKLISEILATYQSRYTTKTNATIYKLMVIALEAELQNVLHNLAYAKLDKSITTVKAITSKYQKIASSGNQNIAPTIEKFIGEIEFLFIEALKIEYEYYIQKERAKEEQKMLREQMRQEAAERKLLEEQRKKVEQEEAKYKAEIEQIVALIALTTDEQKLAQLQERANKITCQLGEVEQKREEILNLQNGKAGYIYIISNLGSFGENLFKVGMTRRLNPQERVDELGDASVPFRFDVHSFIFSNSAPELEAALHRKLHNQRVNKVNLRKEFFTCSIDELERLVYDLEPTAEFNKTMLAEQYHQSMAISFIPDEETPPGMYEDEELEEELA